MRKAIFIDKDGTLVKNVPYNVTASLIEINDGAGLMLQRLRSYGYAIVVVSNQSGIAHGYFTEEALNDSFVQINKMLTVDGAFIDEFYYCPHHSMGKQAAYAITCDCRKPKPGLLIKAANELDLDLTRSWMIGDILDDIEAGNRAGCKTVLMDMGNETEWNIRGHRCPTLISERFEEVTDFILSYEQIAIS
jgi:D-glycero-D-manno-heptose 1,7-bisphosphate phosphatase